MFLTHISKVHGGGWVLGSGDFNTDIKVNINALSVSKTQRRTLPEAKFLVPDWGGGGGGGKRGQWGMGFV